MRESLRGLAVSLRKSRSWQTSLEVSRKVKHENDPISTAQHKPSSFNHGFISSQRPKQLRRLGRTWWWWSGLETWSWQMMSGPTIHSLHPLTNLNWVDVFNAERGGWRGRNPPLTSTLTSQPPPFLIWPSPHPTPTHPHPHPHPTPPLLLLRCFGLLHVDSSRSVGYAEVPEILNSLHMSVNKQSRTRTETERHSYWTIRLTGKRREKLKKPHAWRNLHMTLLNLLDEL